MRLKRSKLVKALALSLLMLWIVTDNHDLALALNYFALFAHRLYGWSYFHKLTSIICFSRLFFHGSGHTATFEL